MDMPTKTMVYKTADAPIKAVSIPGIIKVIASEEVEDRAGDLIRVSGWQLDEFRRNPVLMLGHRLDIAPVGTVQNIQIEGKQLVADLQFDMQDPLGAELDRKFRAKIMRAVSVGFLPLAAETRTASNGRQGMLYTKQTLLELSVVSVPMLATALSKSAAATKGYQRTSVASSTTKLDLWRNRLAEVARECRSGGAYYQELGASTASELYGQTILAQMALKDFDLDDFERRLGMIETSIERRRSYIADAIHRAAEALRHKDEDAAWAMRPARYWIHPTN
jgi:phage head maturation protease